MELTTEHSFYKNADEKWKKQMRIIFGVGQQDKTRNSVGTPDRKMMKYLCNKPDMHGYAMNGKYKADKFGDYFHAELVLCNPTEDTKFIDEEDHTKTSTTPPRLQRKTNPRLQAKEEEEEYDLYLNNMDFNSSLYGSPMSTPVKGNPRNINFNTPGGKGQNKKTKRKTRKSKKSKRKQRKTRKR